MGAGEERAPSRPLATWLLIKKQRVFIITKKHKKQCRMLIKEKHCDRIKTVKSNVPSINYPFFAKIFKFFVVKLKIKCWVTFCFWVWLNITLLLRIKKSNKVHFVQTTEFANSKTASYQGTKFCPRWGILGHFLIYNFLVISPLNH